MLLTLTASSAPNFILIGPGLVWQTLPAGWVDTFESHYTVGNLAHQGEHWPVLITPSNSDKDQTVERTVGNLKKALKVHIASRHAKGLTYQGLYLKLWNDIQHELHKSSHTYWKAPHKVIRNVIRARFGGLYNQKLACR